MLHGRNVVHHALPIMQWWYLLGNCRLASALTLLALLGRSEPGYCLSYYEPTVFGCTSNSTPCPKFSANLLVPLPRAGVSRLLRITTCTGLHRYNISFASGGPRSTFELALPQSLSGLSQGFTQSVQIVFTLFSAVLHIQFKWSHYAPQQSH
jgi:hypothetical protein